MVNKLPDDTLRLTIITEITSDSYFMRFDNSKEHLVMTDGKLSKEVQPFVGYDFDMDSNNLKTIIGFFQRYLDRIEEDKHERD